MGEFNDFLYFYPPVKKIRRGGLGSTIFIIKGTEKQLLIDPSVKGGGIQKKCAMKMEKDGISIENTDAILLTHTHPDHMVATSYWRNMIDKETPIPVYVHPAGVEVLANPKLLGARLVQRAKHFQQAISKMPVRLGDLGMRMLWGKQEKIHDAVPLKNMQVFDLGNIVVTAIFTPGHDISHVAYKIEEKARDGPVILLSGDMISFKEITEGEGIRALASVNTASSLFDAELKSLRRILQDPPDVLFTSHYGIFEPKEVIIEHFRDAVELAETYKPKILKILQEGPKSFKEITKELIWFDHYLSGYATRTSTVFCIIREMLNANQIIEINKKKHLFALALEG